MIVIVSPRAENSLDKIGEYISKQGYPETSIKFLIRLNSFFNSLSTHPEKYPYCRHKSFARRNFRCVPFAHNYIIIYKVFPEKVIIKNVVHAKRIR